MEALKEWVFILFWTVWISYFLVHKGIDHEWKSRHPTWWWVFSVGTIMVYLVYRDHLDWNAPEPSLILVLFVGIMIGRYALSKQKRHDSVFDIPQDGADE